MRGATSATADCAAFPFYARRMGPVRALCLCRSENQSHEGGAALMVKAWALGAIR